MSDMPGSIPPPPPPTPGGGFGARPIGEILSAAFDLYRKHWKALITIVAVVSVPLTFLQYALQNSVTGVLTALLLAFFGIFIGLVLQGAITRAAAGTLLGRDLTTDEAFRYGVARAGSILLLALLVGLSVGVGFLLLVIPGIIFAVKLGVSVPALVIEDQRGTKAMSRSWNLTTGHFWHVLGTVFLAAIIAGVVAAILTAPFASSAWVIRWIFGAIASVITTPFTALVGVLIYIDLRARKESLGPDGLAADLARSEA